MTLPIAIVFIIIALFLIFRKSTTGKIEKRKDQEISGNEKKIIKPKS